MCFVAGWGVWGLWIGLSLGLIVTGVILFWVWTVKIAHYRPWWLTTRTCTSSRRASSPGSAPIATAITRLGWEFPESGDALGARWVAELDKHGVQRAALIASLPGDADAVAMAVAHNPDRFVGFFMLDPTRTDAIAYAKRALDEGLRTICLFPAMHGYSLHDPKVADVFELAAARRGGTVERVAVFAHCGVLSVGIRKKLGLPSHFDIRFGNPLDLHGLAMKYPAVPIIIPHFGAGMLREALMLADCCPNVHLDTSSSNSWIKYTPGLTLEQVFKTALDVVGPDRLIFGTRLVILSAWLEWRSPPETKIRARRHWRERGCPEQESSAKTSRGCFRSPGYDFGSASAITRREMSS